MRTQSLIFFFIGLLALSLATVASGRELKQEDGTIQVDYGKHFLFRSDGRTYAILMTVAENSAEAGVKGSEHAINYTVSRLDETGLFRVIGTGKTDERKAGSGLLETKDFKLEWSWNTPRTGWLYIGRWLPKGTEFYKTQLKSLEEGGRGLEADLWSVADTK